MLIVSSCDQGYFPLVKGLFLSLLRGLGGSTDIRLGFLDLGCDKASIDWMKHCGVLVRRPSRDAMGNLADVSFGNRRAQTCRPFLPRLFPGASCIAWMDADMWVQDVPGVLDILRNAEANRDRVLASPEVHFTYTGIMDVSKRSKEVYNLNKQFFGHDIASEMSSIPVYNSGFVVASSGHPLWEKWSEIVTDIYMDASPDRSPTALHFAEQIAFNRCIREIGLIHAFDPLYNYLCLWSPPFRDPSGTVRLSAPPNLPIGVIHLAGGWRFFGQRYLQARLLFDEGRYLAPDELEAISATVKRDFRYRRPAKGGITTSMEE